MSRTRVASMMPSHQLQASQGSVVAAGFSRPYIRVHAYACQDRYALSRCPLSPALLYKHMPYYTYVRRWPIRLKYPTEPLLATSQRRTLRAGGQHVKSIDRGRAQATNMLRPPTTPDPAPIENDHGGGPSKRRRRRTRVPARFVRSFVPGLPRESATRRGCVGGATRRGREEG